MAFASEPTSEAPPAQVQCTGCGRTLRLRPERAGLRQSCPICKTITPHPRHGEFVRERQRVIFAFATLGVLGLIPLTWPAGLYLVAVSVLVFVFQYLKYRGEESGADKSTKKLRVLNFNIFKTLRDTASSVGAGMAVVCVLQLLLRTSFFFVDPLTVRALEDWIVSKRAALAGLLQFKWLLLTLTIMVVVSFIWPSTKPVSRYLHVRSWVSRLLIVLSVISSFTFFTSNAIAASERKWIAERKDEYKQSAATVRSARERLAKAAYIQKRLETLPAKSRRDLRTFFKGVYQSPERERIIRDLAGDIARKMPPDKGPIEDTSRHGNSSRGVGRDDSLIEISLEKIEGWGGNDLTSGWSSTPTFEDGWRVTKEARRYDKADEEAEAAVEAVVKTIIGDQLASIVDLDALVKPFAKALIGGIVKTSFPKGILSRIHSFKDADNIIPLNLTPEERGGVWDLDVGKVAEYESPPSRTAPPAPQPNDDPSRDWLRPRSAESVTIEDFSEGLEQGRVVTRNPEDPHRLFVHRARQLNTLVDLEFLIKESPNGEFWTVYLPSERGGYGRLIGKISRPSQVDIGRCDCPVR